MPREKHPQILIGKLRSEIGSQQALNRGRHVGRRTPITERARYGLERAHAAAHAEIIRVYPLPVHLQLLAFNPDVGNPVLPATVWTSRYVKFEMLLESR